MQLLQGWRPSHLTLRLVHSRQERLTLRLAAEGVSAEARMGDFSPWSLGVGGGAMMAG